MSDREYFADLKKIYVTEALGASIYNSMVGKMAACGLRDVYVKLGANERRMMALVDTELRKLGIEVPELKKNMTVAVMSALFRITPLVMQQRLLIHVAKKKIFGRWYSLHHQQNEELWGILLEHERLQYGVLVGPRSADGEQREPP